jgi:hypothetical protein
VEEEARDGVVAAAEDAAAAAAVERIRTMLRKKKPKNVYGKFLRLPSIFNCSLTRHGTNFYYFDNVGKKLQLLCFNHSAKKIVNEKT